MLKLVAEILQCFAALFIMIKFSNYFDSSINFFSNLIKFLDISAKSFFSCAKSTLLTFFLPLILS